MNRQNSIFFIRVLLFVCSWAETSHAFRPSVSAFSRQSTQLVDRNFQLQPLPSTTSPHRQSNIISTDFVSSNRLHHRDGKLQQTKIQTTSKTSNDARTKWVKIGCALAANSGFLNALGLSGVLFGGSSKTFAACTTTYTKAGVAFLEGSAGLPIMITILGVPFAYLMGSMINGLINPTGIHLAEHIDVQTQSSSQPSRNTFVETLPLLLSAAMVLFSNSVLSQSSLGMKLSHYIFAMALGLQNSWTSGILQGNALRTSHFSGITSDMGTFIGQIIRGNNANAWKLKTSAKLTFCFWAGGMMSVLAVQMFGIGAASLGSWASSALYLALWIRLSLPSIQLKLQEWMYNFKTIPVKLSSRQISTWNNDYTSHIMGNANRWQRNMFDIAAAKKWRQSSTKHNPCPALSSKLFR